MSENFVTYERRKNELWLSEFSSDNLKLSLRVKSVLHSEKTKYQDLLIVDTYEYGKTLMLDGAFQLTEREEFCYSEMMAHVPLCSHKNPKRVLIIGGGDGAILREVLKHECVEKCTLIDIDERVIENSKKFLPTIGCELENPRADVRCMDALEFIKNTEAKALIAMHREGYSAWTPSYKFQLETEPIPIWSPVKPGDKRFLIDNKFISEI